MARRLDQERCTLCNTRMLGLEACPVCGTALRSERPSTSALSAIVASSSANHIEFAQDLEELPVPLGRPIAAPFVNTDPRGQRTIAHLEAVFSTQDLPVLERLVAPSRVSHTGLFGALAATIAFAASIWLMTSGVLGSIPEASVGTAKLEAASAKEAPHKVLVSAPDDRMSVSDDASCTWEQTDRVRRRGSRAALAFGGEVRVSAKEEGGALVIKLPGGEETEVVLPLRPRLLRHWRSPDGTQDLVLVESYDQNTVRARLLSFANDEVDAAVLEATLDGDARAQSDALGCTLMKERLEAAPVKVAAGER